ncbi:hypothetical protein NE235_07350 [Actinoallomurus spadix]|uniref:Glutathionylspermidine synthase pre-ATP-grasp-like domain-containing protein n=1 Tax=Actinoallomurus spadix TaxID=79912 RepID=A0ABP3FLN3_9ACTN|nr:hypothetical protein [Actinoallomurus spadix]MCO5985919.1 hypothetical protein [Actinoallomurus spadix]
MTALFDPDRLLSTDSTERVARRLPPVEFARLAAAVREAADAERLVKTENGRTAPYPMLASLVQLTADAERHLARHVPLVVSAWRKVLLAHRTDARVRDFLAVPAVLRAWVDAAPIGDYRVDFCRFDLVGGDVATARVVEFNANCPGGVLFTSAYAALWRDVPPVRDVLEEWGVARTRLDDRHWFPEFLRTAVGPECADGPFGIFHKTGGNVLELDRMTDLLAETGHSAVRVDPGLEDWLARDLRAGYLKYGVQPVLADIARWPAFLDRVSSGKLRIANPLAGRWIGDNKLCLALLSDPRFSGMFTAAEQEAVERLIPYSRKVGDGVEPADLLADRAGWVVKGPYDTRGNSVYVGSEQEEDRWRTVVRRAAEDGWLAQRAVPAYRREWQGRPCYQDLSIVLLHGAWAGYTSRISESLRVNVAQGGGRQVVFGHRDTDWGAGERPPIA